MIWIFFFGAMLMGSSVVYGVFGGPREAMVALQRLWIWWCEKKRVKGKPRKKMALPTMKKTTTYLK